MAKAMLEAHNTYRAALKLTPLTWSDRLAELAAKWAAHIAAQGGKRLIASDSAKTGQGENLWMGPAGSASLAEIIRFWGASRQKRWGSAKLVGCAFGRAGGNDILVCRYWPPKK